MKLFFRTETSTMQPLKFRNGRVISYDILINDATTYPVMSEQTYWIWSEENVRQ